MEFTKSKIVIEDISKKAANLLDAAIIAEENLTKSLQRLAIELLSESFEIEKRKINNWKDNLDVIVYGVGSYFSNKPEIHNLAYKAINKTENNQLKVKSLEEHWNSAKLKLIRFNIKQLNMAIRISVNESFGRALFYIQNQKPAFY